MVKDKRVPSQEKPSSDSVFGGLQLVLIQSILCIMVLLIVVIVKTAGGTTYENAVTQFQKGIYEHHLFAVSTSSQNQTTTTSENRSASPSVSNAVAVSNDIRIVSPPLTDGIITSQYGQRVDPITGAMHSVHHGVDIAAPKSTPLQALMDGTVTEVGYEEDGYGWYVIVQCAPQYHYVYAHCDAVLTEVGCQITSGDVIALVGSTGKSTGDHLHFEWRENGKAVDPMSILPKETYG